VIRFVRIFAYVLGGFFSVLFFFNLRKYVAQNSGICTHILFDNKICSSINFDENGLGYTYCDFFTNSSGHPGWGRTTFCLALNFNKRNAPTNWQ
jgi:hypothetical protein